MRSRARSSSRVRAANNVNAERFAQIRSARSTSTSQTGVTSASSATLAASEKVAISSSMANGRSLPGLSPRAGEVGATRVGFTRTRTHAFHSIGQHWPLVARVRDARARRTGQVRERWLAAIQLDLLANVARAFELVQNRQRTH